MPWRYNVSCTAAEIEIRCRGDNKDLLTRRTRNCLDLEVQLDITYMYFCPPRNVENQFDVGVVVIIGSARHQDVVVGQSNVL